MKKWLVLFACISLFAEEAEPSYSLWDFHPIHGGGNLIALGKADVDIKNGPTSGEISFNKANAFLYMLLPINKESYFFPRVEWNGFTMDWDKNPKFNETHFQFIQFSLTFYTIAIEKWRWISRVEYNVDAKHFSRPKTYGLFSALLWGTHEISSQWHYHVGALGYTGYEGQEIYPIIGLDYAPTEKWMFQLVFPMNYSVEYNINKEWRLSLKAKPLKERFRTGKQEPQPRSIFCYSSTGAEVNVHYEKFLHLEVEAYAGYNFGGDFYIKDKTGQNALYTHVKGAPYVGASLNWGF
jgi:hypothetical protein